MADQPPALPLSGIRVLDIGTLLAGPVSTTLLADFGAEVIKVEQPGSGDSLRQSGASAGENLSLAFLVDGRNKKSVTLNLRLPKGQELARRLVEQADVVVENFTPGTLERWGLGWEELHARNPALIMVRVSGFGQTGPSSHKPGYDRVALGFSGYMYPTGYPDRPPVRPAFPTADYSTAMYAAFSTMMALYWRDAQGGQGQMIDLALYEPLFRISSELMASYVRNGKIRERVGNRNPGFAPAGNFLSADGRWVQIAAGGDNMWVRLAAAMGRPDLGNDERYGTSRARAARADELEAMVGEWIAQQGYDEAMAALDEAGVAAGGILTAADIASDPHFAARENILTIDDPRVGPVPMPAPVPKMSATPGRVTHAGPDLGAHNHEIYEGLLGLSGQELAELAAEGVI